MSSSLSSNTELEEAECFEVRIFIYDSQKPSTWRNGTTFTIKGHLDWEVQCVIIFCTLLLMEHTSQIN
jgi:hypothetical protein